MYLVWSQYESNPIGRKGVSGPVYRPTHILAVMPSLGGPWNIDVPVVMNEWLLLFSIPRPPVADEDEKERPDHYSELGWIGTSAA